MARNILHIEVDVGSLDVDTFERMLDEVGTDHTNGIVTRAIRDALVPVFNDDIKVVFESMQQRLA